VSLAAASASHEAVQGILMSQTEAQPSVTTHKHFNASFRLLFLSDVASSLSKAPKSSMAASSETPSTANPIYFPLQDSHEIRLLYLQPGSRSDKIRCIIKHVKLPYKALDDPYIGDYGCYNIQDFVYEFPPDELPYEALSYVWGPEKPQRSITINENDLNVRENLWLALYHLRLGSETRVLWIDAICIDQMNIHERNHQVTQMGMIYNLASRVIVWLGPSDEASLLAFPALMNQEDWPIFFYPSGDPSTIMEGNRKLSAIYSLLTREYWTRLWIIQEFLMARDFFIQCGNDKCTRMRISWFITWIEDVKIDSPGLSQLDSILERAVIIRQIRISAPVRLLRRRYHPQNSEGQSLGRNFGTIRKRPFLSKLFQLYFDYKEAECADQRDKVFGLHSLGFACCRQAVPIDYTSSWPRILGMLQHHETYLHGSIFKRLISGPSNTAVHEFREFYQESIAMTRYSADKSPSSTKNFEIFANEVLDSRRRDFLIGGYARGRICYVSGSLKDYHSGTFPKPSDLTPMVKLQLKYIWDQKDRWRFCQTQARSEIDIVRQVTHAAASFDYSPSAWLHKPIPYSAPQSWKLVDYEHSLMIQICNEIVRSIPIKGSTHLWYSRQLAFEENGLVFLIDEYTKVGDLVCQFHQSDVLAVLSFRHKPDYEPVEISRAVNFLTCPSAETIDICGQSMSGTESPENRRYNVRLHLNTDSIRCLTGDPGMPGVIRR
jgi:hypothetical protein